MARPSSSSEGAESMNTENQWQLTGSAAERYERVLVPAIFAPWAADLVELAQLQDGERVLDVACGTGVVARHAAQKVGTTGHVTGLDLNQGMVRVARSLPSVPEAAAIVWIEGSALAMHLPDAAFDVVLCQQGVQFFPDRLAALHEMRRVLVPGGRVLVSVWAGPTPYSIAMWNAVERHVEPDAAATFRMATSSPWRARAGWVFERWVTRVEAELDLLRCASENYQPGGPTAFRAPPRSSAGVPPSSTRSGACRTARVCLICINSPPRTRTRS